MTRTGAGALARMMVIAAVTVGLSACVTGSAQFKNPLEHSNLTASLPDTGDTRLGDPYIRAALEALERGDYLAAQKGFNRALKFEPANSQLHFLNGLVYHLRAAAGDSSQAPFAAIGYRLALQYDPSNYWAAYQLGHINFNDQRYREAQDAFAYALLFAPEDVTLLKALATASYFAQDLSTAASAVEKAESVAPRDPGVLRMAALVNAAGAAFGTAYHFLGRYGEERGGESARPVAYLSERIRDWKRFHERNPAITLAQADILGDSETQPGLSAPSGPVSSGDSGGGSGGKKKSEMAMVDVVIIRSEERRSTDKGVNLLSGLSATLGGTTFTFTGTRTANDPGTGANTLVNTFTYNPTLSLSATYSLNIFNDNNDHNEVLARPSLVALDGKKSEFFTGAVFHVQLSGVAGSEGSVSEVPVGIKLDLTPRFLDDGMVELNVYAARAFIEGRSSQIGFSNFAQITKTLVTANVAMKFGDTVIISGLSEKETENLHDGVPLLQDIPGVQYLFSHEDTLDTTKSVLILLTPRKARYVHEDGSPKANRAEPADAAVKQPNLDELKGRIDTFKPAANLDAAFQHLKDGRMFKEFRTGDVRLENWVEQFGLGQRIKRAVEFLYF